MKIAIEKLFRLVKNSPNETDDEWIYRSENIVRNAIEIRDKIQT